MDWQLLKNTVIFKNMTEQEIGIAFAALQAGEKSYRKGAAILHGGTTTKRMGFVLTGSVTIENNDAWGNRTIIGHAEAGQFFAETYAFLPNKTLLVDVRAKENCRILFLGIGRLHTMINNVELWQVKLLSNLLDLFGHKNLLLSERSFHTAPKTIRGRVLAYLNSVSLQKHSSEFDIPFDRQQLADYLNIERSALSKELGKMQRDGIIAVRKKHFVLM